MIQLTHYIASGRFRDTYVHPQDSAKIVKVSPPITNRINDIGLYKSVPARSYLWSRPTLSAHEREIAGIKYLEDNGVDRSPFFTQYFGQVVTDKGVGIVCERIENYYYASDKTLADYLVRYGRLEDPQLEIVVARYFEFLFDMDIYCTGGGPENIALVRDENGCLAVKIFDIKFYENKHFSAPIMGRMHHGHSKIQRRLKRQKELIFHTSWAARAPETFKKRTPYPGDLEHITATL